MASQPVVHSPRAAVVPVPEPADEIGLDTRISVVEQGLVAREQRLRNHVETLGSQARQAIEPRALLLKVAGAALAGAGLVWALRRGGGRRSPMEHRGVAAAPYAGGPSPLLLSLLPMAWPLLPARWRNRVSPATAATVLGLAVPLMLRLAGRRSAGDTTADGSAPATVAHLDLLRYAGTWHEQARLPQPFESFCAGQPRATYTPQGGLLGVRNECRSADGRLRVAEGVARVVPGSGGARLEVTFMPSWLHWLPLVWADLWVLHVDDAAADYRVAIAGHPSRLGLWLLSRSPHLPADELQRLIAMASDLGYNTGRLVMARSPSPLH